jgi:hypothetical protein
VSGTNYAKGIMGHNLHSKLAFAMGSRAKSIVKRIRHELKRQAVREGMK